MTEIVFFIITIGKILIVWNVVIDVGGAARIERAEQLGERIGTLLFGEDDIQECAIRIMVVAGVESPPTVRAFTTDAAN